MFVFKYNYKYNPRFSRFHTQCNVYSWFLKSYQHYNLQPASTCSIIMTMISGNILEIRADWISLEETR